MHAHTIVNGPTRVTVIPERGAIVSAIDVAGRALLFMDAATLADPSAHVRGGVPVLFPFAGRLAGDRLVAAGTTMRQHGFGRDREWELVTRADDALTVRLGADAETRAVFPYEFAAELRVEALADGARLTLRTRNTGETPLPLAPGWHPYFACALADKARVACDGLTAGTLDDAREYDLGLDAPASGVSAITPLDVTLEASATMKHRQVWTLPGRPFVCVEPFWGAANAINTAARALVEPGQELTLSATIRARSA